MQMEMETDFFPIDKLPREIHGMALRRLAPVWRLRSVELVSRHWAAVVHDHGWSHERDINYEEMFTAWPGGALPDGFHFTIDHMEALFRRAGRSPQLRRLSLTTFGGFFHDGQNEDQRMFEWFGVLARPELVEELNVTLLQLDTRSLELIGAHLLGLKRLYARSSFIFCDDNAAAFERGFSALFRGCRQLEVLDVGRDGGDHTGDHAIYLPPGALTHLPQRATLRELSFTLVDGLDHRSLEAIAERCHSSLVEFAADVPGDSSASMQLAHLNQFLGSLNNLKSLYLTLFLRRNDDRHRRRRHHQQQHHQEAPPEEAEEQRDPFTGHLPATIEDITLWVDFFNDGALRVLSRRALRLTALKQFRLIHSGPSALSDDSIRGLAALPALEELDLEFRSDVEEPALSDATFRAFAARGQLKRLYINLHRRCETVTDDGVVELIRGCPQLVGLHLREAAFHGVGEPSIRALFTEMERRHGATLPTGDADPRIFRLDLDGAGLEQLCQHCPWVRLVNRQDYY